MYAFKKELELRADVFSELANRELELEPIFKVYKRLETLLKPTRKYKSTVIEGETVLQDFGAIKRKTLEYINEVSETYGKKT